MPACKANVKPVIMNAVEFVMSCIFKNVIHVMKCMTCETLNEMGCMLCKVWRVIH